MEPVCAVCGDKAPNRCGSCLSISYCSSEHQKKHWNVHRKNCPHFKIVEVPNLGKGFVATRDIKAGTVILDEDPVTVSPSNMLMLACLTCGLDDELMCSFGRRCSRCKWPVCSFECQNNPFHAENECQIFASGNIIYSPESMTGSFVDNLMGIRVCLLKRKNPQIFQQVLELCSEYSLQTEQRVEPFKNYMREVLDNVQGLDLDSGEIAKLRKIFRINCYSGKRQDKPTTLNPGIARYITGLYLKSSRINHSCIPNCHWEVGSKPDFQIRIRTTREIKKGESLTVFYWMEHIDEIPQWRQEIIRKNGHFRCDCARCKDPTELGTYRSGIVCKTCRGKNNLGFFLPEDPLNFSPNAKWKCNCCRNLTSAQEILPVVKELQREIFEMTTFEKFTPAGDKLIDFCKSLVEETSGIILHPNHWVIQNAITVAGEYLVCHRQNTMSLEMSEYFVKNWKHLLSILDLLTPGITQSRANAQMQLATALHLQCKELLSRQRYEEVDRNFEECLVLLNEALKFFKNELPIAGGVVRSAVSIEKNISKVLVDRSTLQLLRLTVSSSSK